MTSGSLARHGLGLLAAALCVAVPASAQGSDPLRKADLVYLLANALISQSEIADVVRRNCLAFHPTERDWADLRTAGAGSEVLANVAACGSRVTAQPPAAPAAPASPPRAPLAAVADPAEYAVPSGVPVTVRVRALRGDEAQRGIPLVLRGSRSLGLPGDARATSNDSGYASFVLPALALPGAYRFEVVTGSGVRLPGRPVVTLTVRAGRPASVTVEPRVLTFDRPGDTLARVAAVVRDPLGNPVPGEVAELHLGPGRTVSAVTDSAGRARFTLRRGGIPTGTFDVRVRGESMAQLRTARADAVSEAETGFLAPPEAGAAGTAIPLVFQVRAVSGAPMAGRPVSFRALNARVRPDSAVTDARGEVAVEAMLGERAGVAAVFGVVDSLERVLTLRVEAAVAVELRLERDGQRVDGGRVQVRYGQPFALKLTAHDAYGNQTAVWPIARVLRENREQLSARLGLLELVDVQDDGAAALLTLKPIRFGRVELTIASGATATGVTVEVVRRWP